MRNRALIARWTLEQGQKDKTVELIKENNKTYVVINDYAKLRALFGKLLVEIQRIRSEGDFKAAQALIEKYAVKIDPVLHAEIRARYDELGIMPYRGFVNPEYELVKDKKGNVKDIKISYTEGYNEQMMRYSKMYSGLGSYND
jgi:dipeptidyl-peptidase-3